MEIYKHHISRKGVLLSDVFADLVSLAVEDYMELTKIVVEKILPANTIQKIWAVENEFENIEVYYRQNGRKKELNFVLLCKWHGIDVTEYDQDLEHISWADLNLDNGEIIRRYNAWVKQYLKDYKREHFGQRRTLWEILWG